MSLYFEFLSGPHRGRKLPIREEQPLTIKTQKSDVAAGEVTVEIVGPGCVLANKSRMICKVNGANQLRARAPLSLGDEVMIGKQLFRLVEEDEHDTLNTQAMAPSVDVAEAAEDAIQCSVCDALWSETDAKAGWSGGDQRICRNCLRKGVTPAHLPRAVVTPSSDVVAPPDAGGDSAASSNESTISIADANEADVDAAAPPPARKPAPASEPVAEPARPAAARAPAAKTDSGDSDSDRLRKSRRISASRLAQVDDAPPPAKQGLLRRMGRVFGRKDERHKRLEELENERRELLLEAGRLSLTGTGGFGIPDHMLTPLLQGEAIVFSLQDLSIAALEQWRNQRQRLAFLDVEIGALRRKLGLGPDPAGKRASPPATSLRSDQRARQESAFSAMDGVGTDDLENLPEDPEEEAPAAESRHPSDPPTQATVPVRPPPRPAAPPAAQRPAPPAAPRPAAPAKPAPAKPAPTAPPRPAAAPAAAAPRPAAAAARPAQAPAKPPAEARQPARPPARAEPPRAVQRPAPREAQQHPTEELVADGTPAAPRKPPTTDRTSISARRKVVRRRR